MKNRALLGRLQRRAAAKHGRIVVLTGARQTGKTTLVQHAFPDYEYISLEDPALRPEWSRLAAADWIRRHPRAVLDEVQKVPSLVETLKAARDADSSVRYLLLGSSQIRLLGKVKESLAGRAAVEELWPLTLPEMMTDSWDQPVGESRLLALLRAVGRSDDVLAGMPAADQGFVQAEAMFRRYLERGAMPAVHDPELDDPECFEWLSDYRKLYLERDVADLAALRDLEPFALAQRALALRTGAPVNFAELARASSIAVDTARRFLRYLELSYQVVMLPAYARNPRKRLVRSAKVHFVDPGVHRSLTGRRGPCNGEEFESYVVGEIFKQVRTAALPADLYHLRTHDGLEVDLLIETEAGFTAVEVKASDRVSSQDARHLRNLSALLDKPLLNALVLSMDREVRELGNGILAVPAAWVLGPAGVGT